MRPYRGKRIDNGEWVYGWYRYNPYLDIHQILVWQVNLAWESGGFFHEFEVDPDSVGQQVGLKDKNSKEAYNSDKISFGSTKPVYLVKWSICNAEFYLESMDEQKELLGISNLVVGKIIGNIQSSPEFLEQK